MKHEFHLPGGVGPVGVCHARSRRCVLDTFQSKRLKNKTEKPTKYRGSVFEEEILKGTQTVVLKVSGTAQV